MTNPKWARGIGLEARDVILAVDGRAVNSFSDIYDAYQQLHRSVRRPSFELTLERDGVPLTKTYLIRQPDRPRGCPRNRASRGKVAQGASSAEVSGPWAPIVRTGTVPP
ncbi:MAG TPA: hypothetical protein VMT34_04935, partial [Aggregatilineales bacterium]|nr:hypothetical protein [Aggregatilineales bacterium]